MEALDRAIEAVDELLAAGLDPDTADDAIALIEKVERLGRKGPPRRRRWST